VRSTESRIVVADFREGEHYVIGKWTGRGQADGICCPAGPQGFEESWFCVCCLPRFSLRSYAHHQQLPHRDPRRIMRSSKLWSRPWFPAFRVVHDEDALSPLGMKMFSILDLEAEMHGHDSRST
jgi:hypothetical protein